MRGSQVWFAEVNRPCAVSCSIDWHRRGSDPSRLGTMEGDFLLLLVGNGLYVLLAGML